MQVFIPFLHVPHLFLEVQVLLVFRVRLSFLVFPLVLGLQEYHHLLLLLVALVLLVGLLVLEVPSSHDRPSHLSNLPRLAFLEHPVTQLVL